MSGIAQTPNFSGQHTDMVVIPPQPATSATSFLNAQSLTGAGPGTKFTPGTVLSPGLGGRNLRAIVVDAGAAAIGTVVIKGKGKNQFGQDIEESISVTTSLTLGEKIFTQLDQVEIVSGAGIEAGDTLSVGIGDKVGIAKMFSADMHEIKNAQRTPAAGTPPTAIAVSTTNFDATYMAVKAAAWAAGAITAGDQACILMQTDAASPDDRRTYGV